MLISIGKKPQAEDLVSLLAACHDRIRHFARLARAIAAHGALSRTETIEHCQQVRHYFVEALPLHVADEDQSVLPRLVGRSAAVDAALSEMRRQHRDHTPLLVALAEALDSLAAEPERAASRARLEATAGPLGLALEDHLLLEERELFPAIAELDAATRTTIVRELRARRA